MIIIIAGRGGGSAGGDHTPFGFFMLQTQLFGSTKPQNKLCIKLEISILDYIQYKWPYRSSKEYSLQFLGPSWLILL